MSARNLVTLLLGRIDQFNTKFAVKANQATYFLTDRKPGRLAFYQEPIGRWTAGRRISHTGCNDPLNERMDFHAFFPCMEHNKFRVPVGIPEHAPDSQG